MSAESTLGAYLRRCRERSGLSAEAVAAGSRIAVRLVHALETDRHGDLPAPVYVRGFVRAYCEQVGADVDEALRRYEAVVAAAPPPPPRPTLPAPAPARRPRRWRPAAAVGVLVVVLGAASTLLLGRAREPAAVPARSPARGPATAESRPPAPAQPATSAAPAAPAQAATAESAAPRAAAASATTPPSAPAGPAMSPDAAPPRAPGPGPAEAAAAAPAAERVLVMRAVDTTWVRVTPDGGPPSEETLAPGAVRQWKSARAFRVTIGNAGGVQLELDGRALPALGGRGQVVHTTIPDERRP